MDAAGKDGAIRHVMSGVNPQGCQVFSFKHPSATELEHDFLWRTTRSLPERGRIGIFNRSYYEEVLIVRVHPEILCGQGLPDGLLDEKTIWRERYRSIVDLESHLYRNGTRIINFFLHLSEEEQRKRFLDRIDKPEKNWKFSLADIEERKYWKQYMQAYEACLRTCSKSFEQKGQEGQVDELQTGVNHSLAVLPQSSILFQPGKTTLDDPSLGHDLKGV